MENQELDDIIRQNQPKLHRYVRGRVSNSDEADDIVQDTLYQFVRTIRALDNPIAHVSAWLYTVAHNLIVNHHRQQREEQILTTDDDGEPYMHDLSEILAADDVENPDMQMLRQMVWAELDKALAELPIEQRQALTLTEIEGMSTQQAAQLMGVSQNTFLSRKHYAVLHVRKRLNTLYRELIGRQ